MLAGHCALCSSQEIFQIFYFWTSALNNVNFKGDQWTLDKLKKQNQTKLKFSIWNVTNVLTVYTRDKISEKIQILEGSRNWRITKDFTGWMRGKGRKICKKSARNGRNDRKILQNSLWKKSTVASTLHFIKKDSLLSFILSRENSRRYTFLLT